jgi:hypothetical protein
MCNIAVVLAGKIPVNLNFTAGRAAIDSAIRRGEIDRFLTADIFVRKMQSFPWPPSKQLILIERLLPKMKLSIVKWLRAEQGAARRRACRAPRHRQKRWTKRPSCSSPAEAPASPRASPSPIAISSPTSCSLAAAWA